MDRRSSAPRLSRGTQTFFRGGLILLLCLFLVSRARADSATAPLRVLVATPEVHPLIKTGGLADVASALPTALRALGHDVRIVVPGFGKVLDTIGELRPVGAGGPISARPAANLDFEVKQGVLPGTDIPVYVVTDHGPRNIFRHLATAENPSPYVDATTGKDYSDNYERWAAFCRIAAHLADGQIDPSWGPDLTHTNDWQAGLIPVYLSTDHGPTPPTVITLHNMAYDGSFPDGLSPHEIGLPDWMANPVEGPLEFHRRLSPLKGGIALSNGVTTVSPTYAVEICESEALSAGLYGLLQTIAAQGRLTGILNGIGPEWNPASDAHLHRPYSTLAGKAANKAALQQELGLEVDANTTLLAHVGRMVQQKGIDLFPAAITPILRENPQVQLAILGTGDREIEQQLAELHRAFPGQVHVKLGYSEKLAHRIEAGADIFLMPSRFEPCGLNQLYSLRYGTPPLVTKTGGLADTVVDGHTGFVIPANPDARQLEAGIRRAIAIRHDTPTHFAKMQQDGMAHAEQHFSWKASAERYVRVYHRALAARDHRPAYTQ